ncbi:hypothetical protein LSH36_341g03018 [Paralvinella palmiformis]|uniref:DH domain-containing protein n=1 Tax=Paralvinella palmiformis TaxID=53620 RepID=A0AAD9JFM4_9ANNE|nr:hypothetical protein LSH36_341g03018 [Paralvinella palmiformis]
MKSDGNMLTTKSEKCTMTADGVLCADDDDDDEISHRSSSVKGGKMSRDPSTDTDVLDTDVGTDDLGSQMSTDEDMAVRLNQLQDMVKEMKMGFSTALEALVQIQMGDQVLQERVNNNKMEHDNQLADVLNMVLSLKRQVELLQYERDILLEELERQGVISEQLRSKYHSGRARPNGLNRSCDQTSLAAMLERAHSVFATPQTHNISDHDSGVNTYRDHPDLSSLADVTPPGVSPFVQSYIAGLQDSVSQTLQESLHQHSQHEELAPGGDGYESDSSLTAAVNKSLDMSRSLGDRCAEVVMLESSDEDEEGAADKNNVEMEDVLEKSSNMSRREVMAGDRMVSPEKKQSDEAVFLQPMTPKRMAPHERNTKEVQRMQVAHEIMDTERTYCSNLWTVIDLYLGPLQSTGILQPKEASVMFPPCLAAIYDYHCRFLQKLEERMTNWKWHSVLGDILCRFIDSSECDLLLQYQTYVSEFPASLAQIKKSCKSSARFRKFLRMMRRHPNCEGLDIGSFMVTPIQRIPRYVLLLKQLLKYTDRDHPDYYYVETALEHIGDFLNKLNDSIEYSMQIVGSGTADETPKPRRKLRIGSFRSASISSYDVNNSRLNDTSIQGSDDHSMLSTSTSASHGRFFNFSFLRDSFKRKNSNANNVTVSSAQNPLPPGHSSKMNCSGYKPVLNQSLSASGLPPSGMSCSQREQSFNVSASREQSFSGNVSIREQSFSNQSLPVRAGKKRRPRHRPKSEFKPAYSNKLDEEFSVPQIRSGHHETQQEASYRQKRARRQRPQSVLDSMSEVSVHSSNLTSQTQWPNTTSQESLNTITADNQTLSSANSSRGQYRHGSSEYMQILPNVPKPVSCPPRAMTKSLPDVSEKSRLGPPRSTNRKLPVPPVIATVKNDYGIYGKNDDLSDENSCRISNCRQIAKQLSVPRSASQGDVVDGSNSPLQHYINVSLARSLTDNHLDDSQQQPLPRTSTSEMEVPQVEYHATTLQPKTQDRSRPKSAKSRHVTLPREGAKPEILNPSALHVQDDSELTSPDSPIRLLLNSAIIDESPVKKEMPFRRKKDRSAKKCLQMEPADKEKEKKKGSLKQSIKSLFFRKRGSRGIDVIPYDEYPENGHQVYTPMASPAKHTGTLTLQDTSLVKRPREQAPPVEKVIVLEPVEPQLETYADENGEPCSAV